MDFQLTEEHELIRNMVKEFVEEHIKPIAAEIDANHRFPSESIAPMAELGLFGFTLPEQYGGNESDSLSYVIASEEIAKVSASHVMILGAQCTLTTPILLKWAHPDIVADLVPSMISGEKLGAFALTEPGAGCDAAAQQTTAVRDGDNYIINGSKIFITNAEQSEVFIVFAMTDKSKGVKGISAFVVERSKTEGFRVGPPEHKMGMHGSHTSEVFLKNCVVPAKNLLGQEGEGFKIAMATLDAGRIGVASMAVGIAQGAMDEALAYIKERVQFGKPIASNQGIQWRVADLATKLEAARLMTYRAAAMKDSGQRFTRESAMAKLYATEVAMEVTTQCVQLMGGLGYTKAFSVERLMREAKITEIFEGTNVIQRIVIAKHVLG